MSRTPTAAVKPNRPSQASPQYSPAGPDYTAPVASQTSSRGDVVSLVNNRVPHIYSDSTGSIQVSPITKSDMRTRKSSSPPVYLGSESGNAKGGPSRSRQSLPSSKALDRLTQEPNRRSTVSAVGSSRTPTQPVQRVVQKKKQSLAHHSPTGPDYTAPILKPSTVPRGKLRPFSDSQLKRARVPSGNEGAERQKRPRLEDDDEAVGQGGRHDANSYRSRLDKGKGRAIDR